MVRLPKGLRYQILERDGFICAFCGRGGRYSNIILEVHHIKWRRHGGQDEPINLMTVCKRCHMVLHYGYCPEGIPLTFTELKNRQGRE